MRSNSDARNAIPSQGPSSARSSQLLQEKVALTLGNHAMNWLWVWLWLLQYYISIMRIVYIRSIIFIIITISSSFKIKLFRPWEKLRVDLFYLETPSRSDSGRAGRTPSRSGSRCVWRQSIGSSVRNSYVSTLCPVVICPHLCTSELSYAVVNCTTSHPVRGRGRFRRS